MAIQVLPENAGYSLVRFVTLSAVTNPTSECWVQLGNKEHGLSVYNKGRAYTCASLIFLPLFLPSALSRLVLAAVSASYSPFFEAS